MRFLHTRPMSRTSVAVGALGTALRRVGSHQRLPGRRFVGVDADRVRADMTVCEEIAVARAFSASAKATSDPPKPWRRRAARVGSPERAALQGCDFVARSL